MSVAFGEFIFDQSRRELRKNGRLLKVDPLQLDLLACFLAHPGRLLSKQELLELVWEGRAVADNVLSVTVAKLRKALGHKPGEREYIENRYGRGYRFVPEVTTVEDAPASQPPATALPSSTQSSPLVGRTDSLHRLEGALARAVSGKGSICMLIGEPGIGKTRLAEALESRARSQGANPVWGRCQQDDVAPALWPFAQVLRELSGHRAAERILHLAGDAPDAKATLSESSSGLMHQLAAFDGSSHHRTIDEATQTLFRLSKQKPLVILLDDLQWADPMSLRLLSYLADDVARWPILIVATVRSTELAPESRRNHDLSRLLRHRNCERIELTRLRAADIDEYVTALFGSELGDVSREVFTRSEGNPFFMIELLRPWIGREGELDPEQLELSGLALDLVRQRVHALPEVSRSVLAAAAVIGHDFDLGLLSHVTGRSHDELLEALDSSLANDTVIPSSSQLAGAYAFDHELIREVLYADLTAIERCRLHHRAGLGLTRRRAAGGEVTHSELAHHYLAALPQGDVANAIEHARRAAAAAFRTGATADARNIMRRALASLTFWVDPDPEVRTALLLELSMVERALADSTYLEHLEQGVALAREHGFGALLALAGQCLSLAPGLILHADAHAVLEAAAEVLPPTDERRRAIVLAHLAWTPPSSSSARRVDALLHEAERLAKSSAHPDALAAVRNAKLFFRAGPETLPQAEAIAAEIEREIRDQAPGARRARAIPIAMLRFLVAMRHGDKAGVLRALEERTALLSQLNNIELNWHHERFLLVMRMNRGELNVLPELERLRQRAQRLRLQAWRTVVSVDYSTLLLWTTDPTAYGERVRTALAPAASDAPATRARKLRSLADFGFVDDLRAALAKISVESLYDLPHDRDYVSTLCQLALAATAAGSREQQLALYELLQPYPDLYAIDISAHSDGSVAHYLAKLARVLGRFEEARAHYERACERNTAFELAPCALQSMYELATLLLETPAVRDVNRAKTLAADVERAASRLGMKPLAEAARKLQAADPKA